MFSKLFNKPKISHPILGEIVLKRNHWDGTQLKIFGSDSVRVRVPGNADGPSNEAVAAIERVGDPSCSLMQECAKKLYDEHYINGRQAADAGEFDDMEEYPDIASSEQIWDFAKVVSVVADPYSTGEVTQIQIGVAAAWDVDHDLGIILQDGTITEFNGSIPPF